MSTLQATNIKNAGSATTNITLDTSGGVAFPQLTGIAKANGSSSITAAARGTDFSLITQPTSVASTSGTSIDFTGIPSGVNRITVIFNNVSVSGTSIMQVQLGDSGGIETTGYTGTVQMTGTGLAFTSGFAIVQSSAATLAICGTVVLNRVDAASNIWVATINMGRTDTASWSSGGGVKTTSAALDRVRITTANGTDTFDSGSVNIQYEY